MVPNSPGEVKHAIQMKI